VDVLGKGPPVKLSCPGCGAEMTLDVLISSESARAAVLSAMQLPAPLGKLILSYLTLFRPPKRQLTWDRLATLLEELQAPIAAAQLVRNGQTCAAPLEYWKAAFEQMAQLRDGGRLQLPLKSHGYLFEVVAGISNKAAGAAEKAVDARRAGHAAHAPASFAPAPKGPVAPVAPIPEEIRGKYVKPRP
jgi:hypothetical protein